MTIQDKTRRTELGKMLLDVSKYVLTIVVIGGLFSEQLNAGTIFVGLCLATAIGAVGFFVIPLEEGGIG